MDQRWLCHHPCHFLQTQLRCRSAISGQRQCSHHPRYCTSAQCSTLPVADSRSLTTMQVQVTSLHSAGSGNSPMDFLCHAVWFQRAPILIQPAQQWTHQTLANHSLYTKMPILQRIICIDIKQVHAISDSSYQFFFIISTNN